jgi:ABC-type phosphate transport system permease subunit
MGTKFTYSLIMTIAGAVLNLLLYFTGYQTEKLAIGQHFQWLGFVMMAVILWLGIKAVREEAPGQFISYGKCVGTGTLISLFSGLMSAVYSYIHFKFVNTDFVDYNMELVRAKWEASGMSATQMEQAEGITRAMMGPVSMAIMTPIMAVIIGLIISLIIAIFLKRPAPAGTEAS